MTSRSKLSPDEIASRMGALPTWTLAASQLHRELQFRDFSEAWGFMARAALEAEKLNHHPAWSNVWSRVVIDLSTHDAGGITEMDFELATRFESLLGR